MAAPQNFRTAFHGFNREDVVRYIDYLTAKHTAQINELKNEIDFLRSKTENHGLDMVTPERMFEAELQRDEYKEQLDAQAIVIRELEAKCAALEQGAPVAVDAADSDARIAELEEKCVALEAQLAQAQAAPQAESNAAELAALNRSLAEALEAKRQAEEALAERNAAAAVLESRCVVLEKQLSDAFAADNQAADARASAVSELEVKCAALEKELADALTAKTQTESAWNAHAINAAQIERRCAALEKELSDAIAAKQQVEQERDNAQKYRIEEELEAYRRAERAERVAQERADKIYFKANGVLADATVKVDEATAQISGLADQVMEQLRQLQNAVVGSKQALSDAAATMYNLRPETEDK